MTTSAAAALIRSAETLFAERGSDRVSVREIVFASGVTNVSAVNYYFGGRRGLVRAVLAKHDAAVDVHRHQMLDAVEASGDSSVRLIAEALVVPLARELDNDDGGLGYLQLMSDLYNRPAATFDPDRNDAGSSIERWRASARPLLTPDGVRLHRRFDAMRFTVAELARRGHAGRKDHRLFTSQLTDLVGALLAAPVSDETARLMRR